MKIQWVEIERKNDKRGSLIVAESMKNIPFVIQRVYCLTNMSGEMRGLHAHKELLQVMICLSGTCTVTLDDGIEKQDIKLDDTKNGLLIGKMIWRSMHTFSKNCILMLLASDWYDENDYIRDYRTFKNLVTT